MELKLVLVFVLYFLCINAAQADRKRRDFGETCDRLQKCNKSLWLACQNGTCDCTKPDEMVYEEGKGKCVSKAGERCRFEVEDSSDEVNLYEKTECVTNGHCGTDGTCACDNGFYEAINGTCLRKGGLGSRCSSQEECLSGNDVSFTCYNGGCGCGPSKLYQLAPYKMMVSNDEFDAFACYEYEEYADESSETDKPTFCQKTKETVAYRRECVGRAGTVCNEHGNCVASSQCNNGVCNCEPEYLPTSNGECGYGFGQECDTDTKVCGDEFICSEGECGCKHAFHQEFDPSSKKCLSIASGPCFASNDCIEHTSCVYNPVAKYGVCKCKSGFVENAKGRCDLAFGAACTYGKQGPACDKGLQCRNGICSCPDQSMAWNAILDKCVVLVDGRCGYWWNSTSGESCTKNAECFMSRPRHEISGTCQCMEGFRVSESRECVPIEHLLPVVTSTAPSKSGNHLAGLVEEAKL